MQSFSMWATWLEFLAVLSCTWLLTYCRGQEASTAPINPICNGTKALDECWNKLPPIRDHGIPSNPEAVETACKVFDSGMKCVKNWTETCLTKQEQKKMEESVAGALETYRWLCKDARFRRDFLQHAECYKKITHKWDDCARKFIESLRRVNIARDVLSLCCIRDRYLHCVKSVAHRYCAPNATEFLQKLAETLVRSTVRTYRPAQCVNVNERNCSDASSAQSSTKFLSTSPSSFLLEVLAYPTKGLINSLNVLQNLAFSDISTFFCALSREFTSPFTSHHHVPHEQLSEPTTSSTITTTISTSSRKGATRNNYNAELETCNDAL